MKIDDIRYALAKQVRAIAYGVTLHCDYGDLRLEGHDAEKVAALVQKLLSKYPDDRYQSSFGLLHDLKRCSQQWQRSRRIEAFELAKALLGRTKFEALLSEAKGDALEGRPTTKTPNHRLRSRIIEALSAK